MNINSFEKIIIITGHYGTGKTNLAINLAIDLRVSGRDVVLADMDVVNPYFRAADFGRFTEQYGLELIAPPYANSNLDLPTLTGAFDAKIGGNQTLILDVGGDDAGAVALGRFAPRIRALPYTMLCVVNRYRYLTEKPSQSLKMLKDIEAASRIEVTALVNNSNLSYETTLSEVESSMEYAQETARLCGKPLAFTSVRRDLYETLVDKRNCYPVDIYVKAPWM